MYSQKSLFGKDAMAEKLYGPELSGKVLEYHSLSPLCRVYPSPTHPCGTTGTTSQPPLHQRPAGCNPRAPHHPLSYAAAIAATLMSSVSPPIHMTSGWMISTCRPSMSLRKPYLEYSCSPVVNLTDGQAALICRGWSWLDSRQCKGRQRRTSFCPSKSSGERHSSHQLMSMSALMHFCTARWAAVSAAPARRAVLPATLTVTSSIVYGTLSDM